MPYGMIAFPSVKDMITCTFECSFEGKGTFRTSKVRFVDYLRNVI